MTRTTLDLDPAVLRELSARAAKEGKTVGRLASELLAEALVEQNVTSSESFKWISKDMQLLVDLEDKEALERAMDDGVHR